jgi:hypothetical protein
MWFMPRHQVQADGFERANSKSDCEGMKKMREMSITKALPNCKSRLRLAKLALTHASRWMLLFALVAPQALASKAILGPHGVAKKIAVENPPVFPLAKVKRGVRGHGYTVFASARGPEPFEFEVLGVMRGYLGPGEDLIIARLQGEQIEKTGVIAGMSGSPVYVDGQLMGAVGYRFGMFTDEPIAGITPIERMLAVAKSPPSKPRAGFGGPRERPFLSKSASAAHNPNAAASTQWGAPKPIQIPISVGGVRPDVLAGFQAHFEARGFGPVIPGGGPSGSQNADRGTAPVKLYAGGPIAGLLTEGDILMAGIGTVTWVHGNRFLAFGHPFRGSGESPLLVSNAHILTTVASRSGSWKMGQATFPVGRLTDDRLHAIGGTMGAFPPMVPIRVFMDMAGPRREHDARPVVSFRTIREGLDTPLLSVLGLANAVGSRVSLEEKGGTYDIKVTALMDTDDEVVFHYRESDESSSFFLIPLYGGMIADLESLSLNRFRPVTFKSITFHANRTDRVEISRIAGIETLGALQVGEPAGVRVRLEKWKSAHGDVRIPFSVPTGLEDGNYTLLVAGANAAESLERSPSFMGPVLSWDDLLRAHRRRPAPGSLTVYLKRTTDSLQIEGENVDDLPPSIKGVLTGGSGSYGQRIESRLIRVARIPSSSVIRGLQKLKLKITSDSSWTDE